MADPRYARRDDRRTWLCIANRVVVADVNADLFRACNVVRISTFYQDLAYELARRTGLDAPSIAILAPDPDHETYLSHAYMARYLGYLLLQGSDLRVANEKVFHKTLAGLQQIDLLVRAVEAANTDPLELNPNGFDGPAGLVQAVRANPHLMANALGSAVIENRGFAGFLPGIAQRLLGQDLLLPDSPRLWLGDTKSRQDVLANPDAYLLRAASEPTARPGHAEPGRKLSELDGPRAPGTVERHRTQRFALCCRDAIDVRDGAIVVERWYRCRNPMRCACSLPRPRTATR